MDIFVGSLWKERQQQEKSYKQAIGDEPTFKNAHLHNAEKTVFKTRGANQINLKPQQKDTADNIQTGQNPFALFHGQIGKRQP